MGMQYKEARVSCLEGVRAFTSRVVRAVDLSQNLGQVVGWAVGSRVIGIGWVGGVGIGVAVCRRVGHRCCVSCGVSHRGGVRSQYDAPFIANGLCYRDWLLMRCRFRLSWLQGFYFGWLTHRYGDQGHQEDWCLQLQFIFYYQSIRVLRLTLSYYITLTSALSSFIQPKAFCVTYHTLIF